MSWGEVGGYLNILFAFYNGGIRLNEDHLVVIWGYGKNLNSFDRQTDLLTDRQTKVLIETSMVEHKNENCYKKKPKNKS